MEYINAVGRRKEAIARVYINEGKGNISINNREFKDYFPNPQLRYVVEQPLDVLELKGKYDIKTVLSGGGIKGQAEALRHAITRALIRVNPEYKTTLKNHGFVTRDPREVERKKPGQPKARKQFQFSKR